MYTIEGNYTLKDNKLYSTSRPLILHIRERRNLKSPKQTPLFIAKHQPSFEYISSLYQQPKDNKQTAAGSYEIPESCNLYLDYKGVEYQLAKNGDDVAIDKFKNVASGVGKKRELTSV